MVGMWILFLPRVVGRPGSCRTSVWGGYSTPAAPRVTHAGRGCHGGAEGEAGLRFVISDPRPFPRPRLRIRSPAPAAPAFWGAGTPGGPTLPASPEQRGRSRGDWRGLRPRCSGAGGLLLSRENRFERPSRGVPGSVVVRSAPRCRMVDPAQLRTRHVPMNAISACLCRSRLRVGHGRGRGGCRGCAILTMQWQT